MPRPPEESVLRRTFKQTIMWIVLAATTGAAAWVDAQANRLGQPQPFDGITVQLPQGWIPTDEHDGQDVLEVRERGEPQLARTLTIRRASLSLRALFRGPPRRTEQVTLSDGVPARISTVANRIGSDPSVGTISDLEVIAIFTPPGGDALAASIGQLSISERSDGRRNEELLKRVLGSVRFTGGS